MKKGLKGSIDDVLHDLLRDEMTLPEKTVKLASSSRDNTGAAQTLPSARARTKSLLENSAFSTMAGLAGDDAEVSDISDADPQALLQDLDDMDADFLGLRKSHGASSKSTTKGSGKEELPSNPKPADTLTATKKGDTIPTKKPSPSPSSFEHQYKEFSFEDLEDPLVGLLHNGEEGTTKKPPGTENKVASKNSPVPVRDQGPSIPLTSGDTPIRKKKELLFDDADDLMASLGFADSPKAERRQTEDQSKLGEVLGRGIATKNLAHPGNREHQEFKLDRKYQRPQDKEDTWDSEDFTFGAYQPTVGSSEGRQSRRQPVRFLAEGGTDVRREPGSKQSTPAMSSPTYPRKGGADWLGLKDEDEELLPPSPARECRRGGSALSTPSIPGPESQHAAPAGLPSSSSGAKPPPKGADCPAKASRPSQSGPSEEKKDEDWLSHVLSQKRSRGLAREEHTVISKDQNSVGTAGLPPPSSQPVASTQGLNQVATGGTLRPAAQNPPARPAASGSSVTWNPAAVALDAGDSKQHTGPRALSDTESAVHFLSSQEPTGLSVPVQAGRTDKQPLLPESLAQSLLPSTEYWKQLLAAQAQLQGGTAELQAELLHSQARLAELEAQVRKLELERTQHKLLLESLQQRHQADLELVENAHRSRINVLETSYQQREERLRRDNEELSAQYRSQCQEAERTRAELTARHQRHLAAAAQEKDQEMERLQELQRASILEMRKDHEQQLQWLKLLKDREIDAVTSATSHTRSLNGIIEQMEKFSSSLNELSSRVEASHLTATQERELGIRQQDEHLRALQESLSRQLRDMEEERSRLQEVIGKMEACLNEQSRLLKQQRWRASAEQAKADSTQHALEEQREVMAQQMAVEQEELQRAKSALVEKQKSVVLKCEEEVGPHPALVAELAEFLVQQKLSKERAHQEAEQALQVNTQRENTFLSLAKEQAELKIRASELQAKEDQLAAERKTLDREWQELRLEKERVASEKYEEAERALRTAWQVQSEQQTWLQLAQQQQQQQEPHAHQSRPLSALAPPGLAPPNPTSSLPASQPCPPLWGWGQEPLRLAQQRQQLDRVQYDLSSLPTGLLTRAQGLAASCPGAPVAPASANPQSSQLPASQGSSLLHAKLMLLKYTAEQDRDFLENEQVFLETLKKASYNMPSHSA